MNRFFSVQRLPLWHTQSASVCRSVYSVTEKYGVELIFFERGEELIINDELSVKMESELAVFEYGGEEISYFSGETLGNVEEYAEKSEYAILKGRRSGRSAMSIKGNVLDVEENRIVDIKELFD